MSHPPSVPGARGSGLGLVLSGGAARGAYEAGVMRFVLVDLARRLGRPTWPHLVSGTSVGALNGLFAAARDQAAFDRLVAIWRSLSIDRIYRMAPLATLRDLLRARSPDRQLGLFDATPFQALVRDNLPAASLRRAIDGGHTRALVVAATEVQTGLNALFVDGELALHDHPGARVYPTRIGADHCRASAAIPFVFPPVAIDGRFHVDGGLRQNTPLRPVLEAGVERALIIGVKQGREREADVARARRPSLLFLAGKMLNALMLDPLERDLWSAAYRNSVVAWGEAEYGSGFVARAAQDLGLRRVDIMHVTPSEDLGRIAGTTYRATPPKASRAVRFLLDGIQAYTDDLEADLLSYLYFDRVYTGALEALGWEDARRVEDSLARLYPDG